MTSAHSGDKDAGVSKSLSTGGYPDFHIHRNTWTSAQKTAIESPCCRGHLHFFLQRTFGEGAAIRFRDPSARNPSDHNCTFFELVVVNGIFRMTDTERQPLCTSRLIGLDKCVAAHAATCPSDLKSALGFESMQRATRNASSEFALATKRGSLSHVATLLHLTTSFLFIFGPGGGHNHLRPSGRISHAVPELCGGSA